MALIHEIPLNKCTINGVCIIPQFSCVALLGSDRNLYFYSTEEMKLVRKFLLPDNQNGLAYYSSKKMLLSYGISAEIYGWNLDIVFGEEFGTMMKENKQTYNHVLSPNMPLYIKYYFE